MPAAREIMGDLGLEPPTFFTLVVLSLIEGSYGGKPVTLQQIRAWSRYIYNSTDTLSAEFAALKEKGLVSEAEDGSLLLSPLAQSSVAQVHAAGRAHVAVMQPLTPDNLTELADQLERAVASIEADPVLAPRPGSQLAGSRSLATFGPDAPAMVRIEQAIYDLWQARDDAHIRAWREAGMEGPPMEALTILWSGEAGTVSEMEKLLQDNQTPDGLESSLVYLTERELVTRHGDTAQLTPAGVLVRDDIEHETDRVYFASWPHTLEEARWLSDKLRELIDNLSTPPPPTPTSPTPR